MTEKEAIEKIRKEICTSSYCDDNCIYGLGRCAYGIAMDALEEIQQYRAIGTVEECRAAVKKLPVAEETIRKLLCSEYGSSCQFCIHDEDEEAMCCNVSGSGSWCCENAKWNGKLE